MFAAPGPKIPVGLAGVAPHGEGHELLLNLAEHLLALAVCGRLLKLWLEL